MGEEIEDKTKEEEEGEEEGEEEELEEEEEDLSRLSHTSTLLLAKS